jgi:hypothetical protein
VLRDDPEVTAALSGERLESCFDLTGALEHADRVFESVPE